MGRLSPSTDKPVTRRLFRGQERSDAPTARSDRSKAIVSAAVVRASLIVHVMTYFEVELVGLVNRQLIDWPIVGGVSSKEEIVVQACAIRECRRAVPPVGAEYRSEVRRP